MTKYLFVSICLNSAKLSLDRLQKYRNPSNKSYDLHFMYFHKESRYASYVNSLLEYPAVSLQN